MQQLAKEDNRLLPKAPLPFHPKNYLPAVCLGFEEASPPAETALAPKEKIHIAMGFDAGYAIHSLTTLASVFGTTRTPLNLEIFLLHSGEIPQKLREKFFSLPPSAAQIHFIEVDDNLLKTLPITNRHITLAAYYRLLLPALIPQSKILWIDGDTIICDDIRHLWGEDLGEYSLGGIPDLAEKKEKKRLSAFYKILEKDPVETYINSGVTLFNLKKIRQIYPDFLIACQDFIEKYPNIIQLEDQDILNLLFIGKIKRLPLKWNLYSSFCFRPRYLHYFSEKEVKQALLKPSLIHYASPWNKPWKVNVRAKTKGLYWYWRQKTGLPPENIKEYLAKKFSPSYYIEKNSRNFLYTPFISLPWMKISAKKRKVHVGKWQGFFISKSKLEKHEKK